MQNNYMEEHLFVRTPFKAVFPAHILESCLKRELQRGNYEKQKVF